MQKQDNNIEKQENSNSLFVAEIGCKSETKYMFCELPLNIIKNKTNLYSIVDLINNIHKSSQLYYNFVILFLCYETPDDSNKPLQYLIHTSQVKQNEQASVQQLWQGMISFISNMADQIAVYLVDLQTQTFQLKILNDIPNQARTQLLTWLQQNNNLIQIHYQTQN